MQIGTETSITLHAILFLSWASISSANVLKDIPKHNPLNIDWYPAPSPEDGPPLSASASRDKALLPAQIGGILGAYLFTVCVIGLILIFIGRKLRANIVVQPKLSDIEMVHAPYHTKNLGLNEVSPVSPGSLSGGQRNFSYPSPEKDIRNPYVFPSTTQSPVSPTGNPHVDTRIVQADREMLQKGLEDIYAHVMEQEEAKAAGIKVTEMPPPPELQRTGPASMGGSNGGSSPKKNTKSRPGTLDLEDAKPQSKTASRASSIISALTSPRLGRKSLKNLRISSPLPTPKSARFAREIAAEEEREPLSPRYYAPPPPPPVPRDQVPYSHSRNTSSIGPTSPTRSIAEQINRPTRHHANPSQTSVQTYASSQRDPGSAVEPASAISATSQTPLFGPPSKKPSPSPTSANSSTRQLPLRQFEPGLTSPVIGTRTTVLERTDVPNGPKTGTLKSPWTAGAVPYSPYQPFSPVIPITPRLVTKEDRKAMKRMMPKTPVTELIQSEKEIWDSGY